MKSLVIYFSHDGWNSINGEIQYISKGKTHILAERIAALSNSDIYRLLPETEYSMDYEECLKRAKMENDNNILPKIANPIYSLSEYDVIYLGFPNWYRSYPRIIGTFITNNNLEGKVIKPFCTNEEGAFGIGELELRGALAPKKAILKDGLAVRGSEVEISDDKIIRWLNK